jgi:hypothetical protein
MTYASVSGGLFYPNPLFSVTAVAGAVIDAATEKFAMIGRLYIDGRPGGTKTLSTGTIQYRTGAATFASGSTTVDIGIQDVATGTGPIAQPDGTFDVLTTLTGGGGGITANAWQTVTMTSGTKSMAHGDLIAVVFDMTARGGADTVTIAASNTLSMGSTGHIPTCNAYISSAWQTTNTAGASRIPNVIIVFDDGTLGWFDCAYPASTQANESYQDSTNPDERGMIFQVPWNCKVDELWAQVGATDASSDFTFKLYSDPTGTPTLVASIVVAAENTGTPSASVTGLLFGCLASEVTLTRNTDYIVTVLATGTSNLRLAQNTLGNTAHRAAALIGGTTLAKATRNNSTGAFTAESPAITMYNMGVRISSLDDGAGGGSSGLQYRPNMSGNV